MTKPWTIKLELVEGCNRRCPFCSSSLPGMYRKYRYADIELVRKVSEEVANWHPKPRFEHGQSGEPTIHPALGDILRIERSLNPSSQITITTNGSIISGKLSRVEALFDAGANHIIVDTYEPERDELREKLTNSNGSYDVYEFCDYAPHGYKGCNQRVLILMDDIRRLSEKDRRKSMQNQAGMLVQPYPLDRIMKENIDPTHLFEYPLQKRCVRPFRELVIKANGAVVLCCDDTFREAVIQRGLAYKVGKSFLLGDARTQSIKDIWRCERFEAARSLLYRKVRDFIPCSMCNYHGGFRVGIGTYDAFEDVSSESLLRIVNEEDQR